MTLLITSAQNARVKQAIKLRNRRARDHSSTFLIEGYRELSRAAGRVRIDSLFVCPELFLGTNETTLIETLNCEVIETSPSIFHKLSYRDRPDGLLGVAQQMEAKLPDSPVANPLYVVAEAIEKPGNLGTILRSADAVGADGVLVCDRCTDIHNPNVVRASVGTLFTQPVIEVEGKQCLAWLKEHGIQVVAATPAATQTYTDVDLTGPIAITVGTEQLGLSPLWLEGADLQVKLPMHGVADSLNVSMATSVLLYEAARQRSN
jgi:RNA methyltransferase, TrmH family